ncbi:restriction endonuclease subunit S, partial [Staphylococcus aureus]
MTNQTKNVPELRFPEFDGEWEERKIGNYIVEIKKYDTQQHSSYSVATSSRRGLFKQAEYFDGNRVFSDKEVLYSVVPPNTITYRHMSDDNIFKFNINSFNESVLVSREYPVFDVNDYADKNFVFYELNNSSNFLKFCIKQKKGGTRTRLYFKVLENYETFYPEKTEQQKIGEFFSKLDRQIELEEQKLEKLEQQKKGYMQKIFSQELRFKDKNGNEYPEWEVIKLKDILSERKEYASKIGNYPHATLSTSGISLKSDRYNRDFLVKDKNKKYKVTIMN